MRIWLGIALLAVLMTTAGVGRPLAADLDEGIAAYRAGDYAQAQKKLEPLGFSRPPPPAMHRPRRTWGA
jgi:hypothetical protein